MNRSIMARRARSLAPRPNNQPVSRNLALRADPSTIGALGPIRNRKAVRMTAIQRNSEGSRSEWNASMYYRCPVAHDQRWSR